MLWALFISSTTKRFQRLCVLVLVAFFLLQYTVVWLSFFDNLFWYEDFDLECFDEIDATAEFQTYAKRAEVTGKTVDWPLCPEYPPGLVGNVSHEGIMRERSWSKIRESNPELSQYGRYSPKNCASRHKVAIIIPLRGRESQLRILLSHMHPIWQRQQMDYQVYAVTQAGDGLFNRAKLLNIGVAEAVRERYYDCYVFHDVDLLLEDDRCLYWCPKENPHHIANYMDKFSYVPLVYAVPCSPLRLLYEWVPYFGGVSTLTHEQFMVVNGFSNLYWGWGGEDDDMYFRLWKKGYSVTNPYGEKCSFRMIPHEHETTNAENGGRYALLYHSISRMQKDGYNSLKYKVLSRDGMALYTNITVDVGRPNRKMRDFLYNDHSLKCLKKVPWRR